MDRVPGDVWIQAESIDAYMARQAQTDDIIRKHPGNEQIIVYCKAERKMKRLPSYKNISAVPETLEEFGRLFGEKNVKVVETNIEKIRKKRYNKS